MQRTCRQTEKVLQDFGIDVNDKNEKKRKRKNDVLQEGSRKRNRFFKKNSKLFRKRGFLTHLTPKRLEVSKN